MLPMLLLAIFTVNLLEQLGVIALISASLAPLLSLINLSEAAALPLVTKYIAGGTAYMGVTLDLVQQGQLTVAELNRLAGLATNPLDLLGVALFSAVTPGLKDVMKAAIFGALVGIIVRSVLHLLIY
ncbi:hypothetical protein JV46_07000 [Solemya velum gill symbiont]|uniref:Nucleoside transporter/FeoB GTPase Gate domain-containing protein n=2 Tax=Solemya velum gill symbiont TaxID=2340 RepID=A0A0B0H5D4_SOVGS|nr:hypothetical protein JV46_07000 [Solemya velum gill symbiont]